MKNNLFVLLTLQMKNNVPDSWICGFKAKKI